MAADPAGETLARFLAPRSIALVGASDRSLWSQIAFDNVQRLGHSGTLHLVNPKGGTIHGMQAATSCRALGGRVDAALLMVPEAAMLDAVADLGEAGAAGAVVLSAGFAETGGGGADRQAALADAARKAGMRLLGPNCLGFVDYLASTPVWATPLRRPPASPTLALISQSGAVAGLLQQFAYQQRVAFTHMISTGNEADLDIADAVDHVVAHSPAKAIALFVESVRDPVRFSAAASAAAAAGRSLVVLKIGTSDAAAHAAQTHTGSLVGDDRVFDALCRRLGIIRVQTLEELIITAELAARFGRVEPRGLALIAGSGGLCEVVIDQAERQGVALPPPGEATRTALSAVLPAYAHASNPLDVTGAVMGKPEIIADAMAALSAEPDVGLVAYVLDSPQKDDERGSARRLMTAIGAGMARSTKPTLMISNSLGTVSGPARQLAEECGIFYTGAGVAHALTAISHLFRPAPRLLRDLAPPPPAANRPVGERAVLDHLCAFGVGIVPAALAATEEEAAAAASAQGLPVVLKVASPDIAHKTEVGGVALGLADDAAVRLAFRTIMEQVRAQAPDARIDGVLVSPMRSSGLELFVGVTVDPQWGPTIAVGLGGIFVEVLNDVSIRLLPVDREDALEMLRELRAGAVLDGVRGRASVNRDAMADAIVAIGRAALALGPTLESLEVNPLLAGPAGVEALDGLAAWKDADADA